MQGNTLRRLYSKLLEKSLMGQNLIMYSEHEEQDQNSRITEDCPKPS